MFTLFLFVFFFVFCLDLLLIILFQIRYWRYGLILTNPEVKNGDDAGGESASVELVPMEKMLRISVRGGKNPSKVSECLRARAPVHVM
jgi:hypothetical protein